MYLHPPYREVAAGTEMTVSEHLGTDVAELYVQAELAFQCPVHGFQHQPEQRLAWRIAAVFPFAVHPALREKVRWHEAAAPLEDYKQVGCGASLTVTGNDHVGFLTLGLADNFEEVGAVEEIAALHHRQFPHVGEY